MDNIRLACAACRILVHRLWNRIRGHQPPPPKPEKHAVCIGLNNSGKSTALALVAGEQIGKIEPTNGFHIKDVQLNDCLLNVKEIGGSEKIRQYWPHYYSGAQGVIFVVNGIASEAELQVAKAAMSDALKDPQLYHLPILLLVSHQDVEGARSPAEIAEFWNVTESYSDRILVYGSSIAHIEQLRSAFNAFANVLLHGTASSNDVEINDEAPQALGGNR